MAKLIDNLAVTTLIINGEARQIDGVEMLVDLLAKLALNAPYFAVAVNDKVVPRSEREQTHIKDGDRIEVVHAVGGG